MSEYPPGQMPTNGYHGWYRDHEGVDRQRVSELIKKVKGDTTYLDKWKLRQVAEGMAVRDDLVLAVKAMGRPSQQPRGEWSRADKDKINDICATAMGAAKERDGATTGTAHHDLTERIDRGEPLESVVRGLPGDVAMTVRAYSALLSLNGWEVVEIERTVDCPELAVRGSFDRVFRIASIPGPWLCQHGHTHEDASQVIGDVKSEKDPTLNGLHIGPQLGIYSRAPRMWIPSGEWAPLVRDGKPVTRADGSEVQVMLGEYVPTPCVRQDVGVVVHVGDGRAVPLFIDLDRGWKAAVRAREQAEDEKIAARKLGAAGAFFAPMKVIEPAPASLLVEQAVATRPGDPFRPGPGLAGMTLSTVGAPPAETGDTRTTTITATFDGARPVPAADVAPEGTRHAATTNNGVKVDEIAVRGADGLVRWEPATAPVTTVGDTVSVGGIEFTKIAEDPTPGPGEPGTPLFRMLIDEIWKATTVERLGELWQLGQDNGVKWVGPVEMAGAARQRQITCVQRALHSTAGKCACGWTFPQLP